MDKMLSKLIVVFSLFFLLLFMYGILINVHKIEENRCKMTYMYEYPQFVKISFPQNDNFPSYGLYAYSEGQMTEIARNMEFSGAPILFIPGNAGSFKQVRSLASVALRKSIDNGWRHHVDYFTVDLSEQYSGLYGGVLNTQVEYVQLCVKHILGLYERFKNGPKTIILIGHSLGGKIAQSVAASPGMATHINSIIAISSPVDFPVLSMDHYYQQFYTATNEQWRLNRTTCRDDDCRTQYAGRKKTLDHILLLTIGGGIRDTMVHDALTSSVFSDVHAMTYNIPTVWLSADHVCIVWCLQLVLVINRFLHSILDSNGRPVNRFTNSKDARLYYAKKYFKDNSFSDAISDKTVTNDIAAEDWIEDIRRNFQFKFNNGLSRTRVQMIPLTSNPLYKYMKTEVVNIHTTDWIFGCSANEMHVNMRFCSHAVSLSSYVNTLPSYGHKIQTVQLNLHNLKLKFPTWTHLLLKLPKTDQPLQFSVDINNYHDRILDIQMPAWYTFSNYLLLDDTQLGSSFYKLNIYGMDRSYQSLAINIDVRSCSMYNPTIIANISVPWAKDFNRISHHKKNHSVIYVFTPLSKPNGLNSTEAPIQVMLHLSTSCRYSLSYSQSLSVTMARIVQQFGQWIPAHCVAILLLSFKHQITVTPSDEHFKCSRLHSALSKSTPFFVITASRVFAKAFLLFRVLPPPEQYDLPVLLSVVVHASALAILLILTAIIWAAIVTCGNFTHKILYRIVSLPIPALSSTVVSCIQKFPIAVGIFLISLALASCGGTALICANFVYFTLLTKMYEEYLEGFVYKTAQLIANKLFGIRLKTSNKRVKSEARESDADSKISSRTNTTQHKEYDEVHNGMVNINFHLPLFLLLLVASLINIPSFLTWAKSCRYNPSLKPDASLIPSIVILSSLSILWQINTPRNISGYKFVAGVLYIAALVCILYCQISLYRLNFVISGIFLIVTIHQLLGPKLAHNQDTE